MTQQDSNESNSLVGQPFPFLWDSEVEQKNITFGLNSPQNYAFNGGNPNHVLFRHIQGETSGALW